MPPAQWIGAVEPALRSGRLPGAATWGAVALICLATLAGAWLARLNVRRVAAWLAAASAVMLVTAVTDILPDAWRDASEHGVPPWGVGAATVTGFAVVAYFTRGGCAHVHERRPAGDHAPGRHRRVRAVAGAALSGGMGTAAALSVHRAIEGATLALSASVVVVTALTVHSASEGLALAALLDMARRPLAPWLVVSCVSPGAGVAVAALEPLPDGAVALLLGGVAGVILRTALVGVNLAVRGHEGGLSRWQLTLAATAAVAIGTFMLFTH
ncbi:hypothetical protein GCM10017673_20880 [Streptosporangium violaceochromogenes]|nr:hypothetical protein GCM10017673_20880 [Streptosporangium violaceochromogenes]